MNRWGDGVSVATLVIALAACGPASSGEPSSEPSSATSSATSAAASEAQTSGSAQASFTEGAVADLEAWIPDTVAGVTMQKQSALGNIDLLVGDDEAAITFLQDLGVSLNDVSVAVGIGYSAALNVTARMLVVRAAGVESDRLEAAFKAAADAKRETPLEWTGTSIGGKQVETAVDGPATDHLYVKGDVLVLMFGSDPDIAAEIVSGLP